MTPSPKCQRNVGLSDTSTISPTISIFLVTRSGISDQKKTGTFISGENEGEYAIPAVGRISTNLSLSDVAGDDESVRTRFFTTGFFVDVTIFGFACAVTTGFGFGRTVFRTIGIRGLLGAGDTDFFSTGPVPFRPSITMVPFCVYTSMQAFSMQSVADAVAVKVVRNITQIRNLFMRGRVGLCIREIRSQKAICG
jgi:hypothetical protein